MKEVGIYKIKIFDIYIGVSRIHQTSNMEWHMLTATSC